MENLVYRDLDAQALQLWLGSDQNEGCLESGRDVLIPEALALGATIVAMALASVLRDKAKESEALFAKGANG